MQNSELSKTDLLAIERTRLANERTFLAYFRTFIVLLSSAVAILKLDVLQEIRELGYALLIISPILLLIGIGRFFYMRKRIAKYYYE
jgi:putative membrane protein